MPINMRRPVWGYCPPMSNSSCNLSLIFTTTAMTTRRERLAEEEEKMMKVYWEDLRTLPIRGSLRSKQFQIMPDPTEEAEIRRVKDKMDLSNLLNHHEHSRESTTHNHSLNNPSALADTQNNALEPMHETVPAGFPDCTLCPKKFELHCKLAEHLILDHGYEKPKCPHCTFSSSKIVNMKRHVKCVHDMLVGNYHCYACKFTSNSIFMTKNHIRTQHTRCPYCQNGFERLSTHERGCAMHPKHANVTEPFKQRYRLPGK